MPKRQVPVRLVERQCGRLAQVGGQKVEFSLKTSISESDVSLTMECAIPNNIGTKGSYKQNRIFKGQGWKFE